MKSKRVALAVFLALTPPCGLPCSSMSDRIKTVKGRAVFLLVLSALFITVLALLFSFDMIRSFERRITAQSVEANFQLISGMVEQDFRNLSGLAWWCGNNRAVAEFLLSADQDAAGGMDAWLKLSEMYMNNRAGRYAQRIIVFDSDMGKFLQSGNLPGGSVPVTIYNLEKVFASTVERNFRWQALIQDPFMMAESLIFPLASPVYSPESADEIGTVFMGAAVGILTDKLKGFITPVNSQLFLSIGNQYYRIEGDLLIAEEFPILPVKSPEGKNYSLLRYPIIENMALNLIFPDAGFSLLRNAWPWLAAGLGVLLLLLGFMGWGVNRMTKEITGLMEKRIADESNKKDLEYRMLQSQINPHFLYNTLNSIKWMASIQNATGIVEMTTAFSRLLKKISHDSRKMVPIRDELAILDDYLVIQKYRYGDSVVMEKKIECKTLLDTPIPRFVLQPLIENAIFHGIEPKGAGVITVEVKADGSDDVAVSITDNGVGMDSASTSELKNMPREVQGILQEVGMYNVDERLKCAFGERYGLSVQSEKGKFTTVILTLPGSVSQNG